MKQQKTLDLYEELENIPDFRRAEGKMHELRFILIIVILSVMSGYTSLRAMQDFTEKNKKELKDFFKPKYGRLPSFKTIGRVLQHVDFEKLSDIFQKWAMSQSLITKKEWVSLDGKVSRGTGECITSSSQNFVSVVTAFSNKQKRALLSKSIRTKKENEIPKVREMINLLGFKKMRPYA